MVLEIKVEKTTMLRVHEPRQVGNGTWALVVCKKVALVFAA